VFIDCDANATYAPSEEIQGVITHLVKKLGNTSSLHRGGQRARAVIEEARAAVRALVGARSRDHVIFTSGASEANNMVIASAANKGGTIVTSTIEHPCILAPCAAVTSFSEGRNGVAVHYVSPTASGVITPECVAEQITSDTRLVSIMLANNETGVINDLHGVAQRAHQRVSTAYVHTDAAQCLGKIPLSFEQLGVDAMTVSGHKFGALTGVGALILREECEVAPLIRGGPQEGKLRGGTENVLGIGVFGAVARHLVEGGLGVLEARASRMRAVRDAFEDAVQSLIPGCAINGVSEQRLPNTSSICIPGVRADDLVVALDFEGILISSGAACSSGKPEPSHVLLAMGQSEDRVRSTIRVSFRADQDTSVALMVADAISRSVERQRSIDGSAVLTAAL
jgi:cysteine desulfurase